MSSTAFWTKTLHCSRNLLFGRELYPAHLMYYSLWCLLQMGVDQPPRQQFVGGTRHQPSQQAVRPLSTKDLQTRNFRKQIQNQTISAEVCKPFVELVDAREAC